jgi:hypothetical protein
MLSETAALMMLRRSSGPASRAAASAATRVSRTLAKQTGWPAPFGEKV